MDAIYDSQMPVITSAVAASNRIQGFTAFFLPFALIGLLHFDTSILNRNWRRRCSSLSVERRWKQWGASLAPRARALKSAPAEGLGNEYHNVRRCIIGSWPGRQAYHAVDTMAFSTFHGESHVGTETLLNIFGPAVH